MNEIIKNGESLRTIRAKINATINPFSSRQVFESAIIPPTVIMVYVVEAGDVYQLVKSPSGDWVSGDGAKWLATIDSGLSIGEMQAAVDLSKAFAQSPTAPDPEDPTSKSAKTWAGEAELSAIAAAAIGKPYASRALAMAAIPTLPEFITRVGWTVGQIPSLFFTTLYLVRKAGAELPLLPAGWVPEAIDGLASAPDHFKERVNPTSDEMAEAFQAALDYAPGVRLLYGDYLVSTGLRVQWNRPVVRGPAIHGTRVYITNPNIGDVFLFEGPDRMTATLTFGEATGFTIWHQAFSVGGADIRLRDVQHFKSDVHMRNPHLGWHFQGAQQVHITDNSIFRSQVTLAAGSGYALIEPTDGAGVKNTEIFFNSPNWRNALGDNATNAAFGLRATSFDGIWVTGGHIMGAVTEFEVEPATIAVEPVIVKAQCQGLRVSNVWLDGFCDHHIRLLGNSPSYGDFTFNGVRGLNSRLESIYIADTCADLRGVRWGIGSFSASVTADYWAYIGNGTGIKFTGTDIISAAAAKSGARAVFVRAAVRKFSYIGGDVGTRHISAFFSAGIEIEAGSLQSYVGDVTFEGVNTEVVRGTTTDSSKVGNIISSRTLAAQSDVVRADAITVQPSVNVFFIITSTGDIFNIIGGWDGREIMLRASVAFTIKHNAGTSPNNILSNTGADISVAVGRQVWLTYSSRIGAWVARS